MAASTKPTRSAVPEDAVALRLVRVLADGRLRSYSATTFPADPWQGCERTIRTAFAVGWLRAGFADDDYGVLDVINDDWDIVADFAVPDAKGFQALKKRLGMVVDHDG